MIVNILRNSNVQVGDRWICNEESDGNITSQQHNNRYMLKCALLRLMSCDGGEEG